MFENYTFKELEKEIVAHDGDKMAAQITWSNAGDDMLIIDHTYVMEGYNGQGLGQELVRLVVEKAKKEGKKIMPLCPFAKHQFDKNEEYRKIKV